MDAARSDAVAARAGSVLQVLAVWCLISVPLVWIVPRLVAEVDRVAHLTSVPVRPTLFHVLLVGLVTDGFVRRKRAALWFVVVAWLVPSVVLAVVTAALSVAGDPGDLLHQAHASVPDAVVTGVVAAVAAVLLVRARSAFPARLAHGSWWRAGLVLVVGLAVASLLTHSLLDLVPDGFDHLRTDGFAPTFVQIALHPDDVAFPGRGAEWVAQVGGALAAIALLAAIGVFLRSVAHDPVPDPDDELHVRRLLRASSEDSLGYFATRGDRVVVWGPERKAGVSYRVISGVCLAAADPVGPVDEWPAAIRAWLALAREHGWAPAVLSASEQGARAYERAGLRVLTQGDEAVLDPATFRLDGPALARVRRAVRHAEQAGVSVLVRRQRDVPADELTHLAELADTWRDGEVERGFSMSMGRVGDPRDDRTVVVTAHDASGAVAGLLTFVPWGERGLSLDVMRRAPNAVGGVTEIMIVRLVAYQADTRGGRVSLNFTLFRNALEQGQRLGATARERVNRSALLLASKQWQLDSLYRANEKFLPEWRSRFVCFETTGQFTLVSFAAAQAEGFLTVPRPLKARLTRARDDADPAPDPELVAAIRALDAETGAAGATERRLTDQEAARRTKLRALRVAGVEPYPASVPRTAAVADVARGIVDGSLDPGTTVSVVGRVVRVRDHGGVLFAELREGVAEVQVMLTADGPADVDLWRAGVDLADQVSVTGEATRSRRGEPTVQAASWTMAAKALRPPPAGSLGEEARVRRRHQHLALDAQAATDLRARSAIVRALRDALHAREYVEVETPVLQRTQGGANARPFRTHINAYDTDLVLRIAPELYLKRLCVGGVVRVFELGRNFRNEGSDSTHNPEFTSLEAYEAYGDYTTMRTLTQQLVVAAAVAAHGEPVARRPEGDVRLDGEWPVVPVHAAVSRVLGVEVTPDTSADTLATLCATHRVSVPDHATAGRLVTELYDELVEPATLEPTFYTDFPVETSPLTRAHRTDPRLAERWDLVACGMELGTAYTELTDPLDQRDRLVRQSLLAAHGDDEAMGVDEDFLAALEFGMPPTGGLGLGVDRLCMLLLGRSIRETLAFPFIRPSNR